LRMGYGLGEAAWGLAQMVGGLMGEVGGGALSVAGAGASATGVGAVVGVPAIAGGVAVIGVSTAAIAEGGADLLTGLGVFASAWNDYKRNPPVSSQGTSPNNAPTGHSPNSSQPGGASGGGKPKVEGAGPGGAGKTLPGVEKATVDSRKVTDYALNSNHPVGGNKAKVFESALGYNPSNAQELIKQLQSKLPSSEAVLGKLDQYGQRYTVDIPITGPNGKTAIVRTGWILEVGTDVPKMTTLFVK